MKTQAAPTKEQQKTAALKVQQELSTGGTATLEDNRPSTVYQRKLQETMNTSAANKAIPIQRKTPKGSSQFQQIATNMGEKYGVDTSGLIANHNSSFPAQLNAEATIQGNSIHFAPGMDTHYNIRHEVAHAIDNTLNGTPKGNQVLNGQKIDTTRESAVDRMAKVSSGPFQRKSLPVQRKLQGGLRPSMSEHATSNASPVQRVRVRTFNEGDITLRSLFKFNDGEAKTYYNCNSRGRLELADDQNPKISTGKGHTYDAINIIPNPPGLPAENYVFFSYLTLQANGRTLNKYGLVAESKITYLAENKDISEIEADAHNPKQGKILPENETDPEISHSDVYQSAISDCYLHSALISVVNSNPQDILNLFDPKPDDTGVTVAFPEVYNYDSNAFQEGYDEKRDTVKMSKNLFLKADGSPLYGGKKSGYLWPAFVQKAIAVLNKSYAKITMGVAREIAQKITGRKDPNVDNADKLLPWGATYTTIPHRRAWEIYGNIAAALKDKKAVNLGTRYWDNTGKKKSKLGIVHSYAIVGMNKAYIKPTQKHAMSQATLTLRDPRQEDGETFKIPFMDVMDVEKVDHISYV